MSTDQFDDLVRRHLEATAPGQAPDRVLDGALDRIAETPQGRSGWHPGRFAGLLAAAAVVLLAVFAGTQLGRVLEVPVGGDPSASASALPTSSAVPTRSGAPSVEPSAPPSPSVAPTDVASSETPVAGTELLLRVLSGGGGPTDPVSQLPWATLMSDGTFVWRPFDALTDFNGYQTRTLTPAGLEQMRQHIFGSGLLDADAAYELEALPGVEPPGHGVAVRFFTVGEGADEVRVTSVQWLGDEEESAYYQPAPEREALDRLASELRDPESLVGEDAWEGPAAPYEATEYQLLLSPYRDTPPYGNGDIAEVPIGFDDPVDEIGVAAGDPRSPVLRCAVIGRDQAAEIVEAMTSLGFAETDSVGMDRATVGALDWADGNGVVNLYLLPRMPDGYPECEDQP